MKKILRLCILFLKDHYVASSIVLYAFVAISYAAMTQGVLIDDSYIFFQYARNWADTGILSFNPGELSFGVSSIGWTLILTCFSYFNFDMVFSAKLLCVIFGSVGTFLWGRWIYGQLNLRYSIGAIIFAGFLPVIGAERMVMGMEVAAVCFFTGLLLNLLTENFRSSIWIAGLIGGFLYLIRPEMILFILVIIIYFLYHRKIANALKFIVTAIVISFWWPLWLYTQIGSFTPPTMIGKLSVFLPESLGITYPQFVNGSLINRIGWGLEALLKFSHASLSIMFFMFLLGSSVLIILIIWQKYSLKNKFALVVPTVITLIMFSIFCLIFPLLKLRYFVWLTPALAISFYAALKILLPERACRIAHWLLLLSSLLLFVPALRHRIKAVEIQQIRGDVGKLIKETTSPDARIALEPIGEIGYYADRYIVDLGGLISTDIQRYIINGYQDVDLMWKCMVDYDADYLVTYDNDKFMGRTPQKYKDRFELIAYIPENEAPIRYRLLRLIKQE